MKFLRRLLPALHAAFGFLMLFSLWRVDLSNGPYVSLGIFYLIPIGYVCWFGGGYWGYPMALLSAMAWLDDDMILARTHSTWLPYWNVVVRAGFFSIVVVVTDAVLRLRRLSRDESRVLELKSNLVSLVSHEFGNYLTIYRLGLTLLRESDVPPLSTQRLQQYAMLERVYSHLSAAVASFLNFNRIESGQFVPHIKKTSLRAQIHGVIALQDANFATKHLSLSTALPPGSLFVSADADALSIVLSNLIGNAFKYTPDGGSVTVQVALEAAQTAIVTVEDAGIGIAPEDIQRISSGCYRAKPGKIAAGGYGVGLKVVRDLLESQHSRLEIDSALGRGSRFSFRLPLWRGPSPDAGRVVTVGRPKAL